MTTTDASHERRRDVSAETRTTALVELDDRLSSRFVGGVDVDHDLITVAPGPALEVVLQRRLREQRQGIGPPLRPRDLFHD
jgi:hypothetical protein